MKKVTSAMLVLCILFTADCSVKGAVPKQNSLTPIQVIDESVKTSIPVSVATHFESVFDTKVTQSKIKNIYYGEDSKVIVSADKLYLYDLSNDKILAEADLPTSSIYFVQPTKNGYAVIGENDPLSIGINNTVSKAEISGTKCTFYDNSLKKTSEISLADVHKDGHSVMFSDHIAISSDNNQIAFSVNSGLYLYDISKKQKSLLIAPNFENANGIAMITQIGFTNNDKSIAFQASSFDLPPTFGKETFPTCGLINTDGTELINNKTSYSIYEMTNVYDTFALFSEDFRRPTGRFLKMDTKSGKTEFLKTSEKKESEYVVGSDKGAYYATAILEKNSWIIRIYNTKTGKLVSEQKATFNEEIYGARIPSVKLIDTTKTCIILLGHTQTVKYPTKVFVKQF